MFELLSAHLLFHCLYVLYFDWVGFIGRVSNFAAYENKSIYICVCIFNLLFIEWQIS